MKNYQYVLAALESDTPPVPWSNQELSEWFDMSTAQVTYAIRHLRRKGYVINMTQVDYKTYNYLLISKPMETSNV